MAFRGRRVKPLRKLASPTSRAFRHFLVKRQRYKRLHSSQLIKSVVYNASNMGTEFIA